MISLNFTQIISAIVFFLGIFFTLVIYIYNNQLKRIITLEEKQNSCAINKLYTILETVRNDILWIKKSLKFNK